MKKTLLAAICAAFISSAAIAQNTVVITDNDLGNGTYNWTKDNVYMLDGYVFLESGGKLNIQEGTVIKGLATPTNSGEASALIITRGAQIFAEGTASEPIIFTAEDDDVTVAGDLFEYDRGLWGGIVLLGAAKVEKKGQTELNIEGIPSTEPRGLFGGTNDADNSGTLKYVSIRHAGNELGVGDELNGLTLGAVGSGTIIDHVEIFANSDDGIEFFGGTAQLKHIVVAFCGDDSYDWDLGYRGKGQFWFAIQSDDVADCGMELDGADPDNANLYSKPTVYNITLIGSGSGASASNSTGILMRDATAGTIANSIITAYAHEAIEIEDLEAAKGVDSRQRMEGGELKILNNVFYDIASGSTIQSIIRATPTVAEDPNAAFLVTHLNANGNVITNPQINSISRIDDNNLDPRASASLGANATYPSDAFFSSVSYKGAFSPSGVWINGWTALSQNGYLKSGIPSMPTSIREQAVGYNTSLYPNPAANTATLSIALEQTERLTIELYDMTGKLVKTIASDVFAAGNTQINFSVNELNAGVYTCKVSGNAQSHVQKLIVK